MREFFSVFKSKKQLIRVLISAVLFFSVSMPFKVLMSLMPGVTEVRPANMLPPVLGLFFGPAGAWGVAIGNSAADLAMGYTNSITLISGFFIQFFFAYLPYKLWYTFGIKDNAQTPSLTSLREIFRYIFIILVDSIIVTIMLLLSFKAANMIEIDISQFFLIFANNFDFAIILGVPILIILSSTKIIPCVPYKIDVNKSAKGFDAILYTIIVTSFLAIKIIKIKSSSAFSMLIIYYLLLFIYIYKPFNKNIEEFDISRKNVFNIKSKVTTGFLIICVLFTAIIGIQSYMLITKEGNVGNLEIFQYIYKLVVVTIHIVFGIMMVILWYVENKITNPIELLSETVSLFAKSEHIEENAYDHIIEKCRSINTNDEIEELASAFSNMIGDIQNYVKNLATVTAERERVTTELNVATQIQSSMLPCIFPAFPNKTEFDIYAIMNPAKEVGGDFYDFFLIGENKLAFVMADVSGKGVPAALFMMISKALIKNLALENIEINEIFEKANNQLNENNDAFMFVTAFMGIVDLKTGELSYVNAGHNPPLIKRDNENFEWLQMDKNCILAVIPDVKFKKQSLQLYKGDIIFTYTDGVTEAINTHTDFYTDSRLLENINKIGDIEGIAISRIVSNIRTTIDEFADGAEQADDITMLVFKYIGR